MGSEVLTNNRKQNMTIEKITPFAYGVFAMLIVDGQPTEITFENEEAVFAYVAFFTA